MLQVLLPYTLASRAWAFITMPCRRGRMSENPARSNPYAASTPNAKEPIDAAINITKFTRSVISPALPH
jgi:hypothetical protein